MGRHHEVNTMDIENEIRGYLADYRDIVELIEDLMEEDEKLAVWLVHKLLEIKT